MELLDLYREAGKGPKTHTFIVLKMNVLKELLLELPLLENLTSMQFVTLLLHFIDW